MSNLWNVNVIINSKFNTNNIYKQCYIMALIVNWIQNGRTQYQIIKNIILWNVSTQSIIQRILSTKDIYKIIIIKA